MKKVESEITFKFSSYVHVCKQVFKNGSGDDQVADADDRSGLDFVVNVVLLITRNNENAKQD